MVNLKMESTPIGGKFEGIQLHDKGIHFEPLRPFNRLYCKFPLFDFKNSTRTLLCGAHVENWFIGFFFVSLDFFSPNPHWKCFLAKS